MKHIWFGNMINLISKNKGEAVMSIKFPTTVVYDFSIILLRANVVGSLYQLLIEENIHSFQLGSHQRIVR